MLSLPSLRKRDFAQNWSRVRDNPAACSWLLHWAVITFHSQRLTSCCFVSSYSIGDRKLALNRLNVIWHVTQGRKCKLGFNIFTRPKCSEDDLGLWCKSTAEYHQTLLAAKVLFYHIIGRICVCVFVAGEPQKDATVGKMTGVVKFPHLSFCHNISGH